MEALMTPEQVADHLQLAPRTIYNWLRQGRLRGIKLGSRWRVKREDLDRLLDRRSAASPRPERRESAELKPLWEVADEYMRNVPDDELDLLPKDLCDNLDHYVYGTPKRSPSA